ncbi:MAG: hypothetical protein JXO51_03680 [Candidatus Aminicenantes bacterium]|nr:hypothetical protein [Candidatus Aminicenantes bacterium]
MANLEAIRNQLPGKLSAGINVYLGISLRDGTRLAEYIRGQLAALRQSHNKEMPAGFSHSRRLYRSFHIDPTRHRPSSEALWRRLRDRDDFPSVHPPVDLTNLLSLKFQVCFGLYDLERVQGPVVITLGDAGDSYEGIRKETLHFAGRIVLRDGRGAFGNPSADSLRASVHEGSRNILQVLFFHPLDPLREQVLAETTSAFREFFTMTEQRSFFA